MLTFVQLPVAPETAEALRDEARRVEIGRLVDQVVRASLHDPLAAVLQATRVDAREAGLTDAAVEDELAVYNGERRG